MWDLAQVYSSPSTSSGPSAVIWIIYAVIIIASIAANWRIFEKAGQKGWKAIIPIYNTYILLRIVGMSPWYLLVFFIPFVNIVFYIIMFNKLAKSFGYGVSMTILCLIVIGQFIIGFGDAKYLGPNGKNSAPAAN